MSEERKASHVLAAVPFSVCTVLQQIKSIIYFCSKEKKNSDFFNACESFAFLK